MKPSLYCLERCSQCVRVGRWAVEPPVHLAPLVRVFAGHDAPMRQVVASQCAGLFESTRLVEVDPGGGGGDEVVVFRIPLGWRVHRGRVEIRVHAFLRVDRDNEVSGRVDVGDAKLLKLGNGFAVGFCPSNLDSAVGGVLEHQCQVPPYHVGVGCQRRSLDGRR